MSREKLPELTALKVEDVDQHLRDIYASVPENIWSDYQIDGLLRQFWQYHQRFVRTFEN